MLLAYYYATKHKPIVMKTSNKLSYIYATSQSTAMAE
jgi:hypothetical protein